ncbi:MAG: hypothetical protein WB586_19375 [Chthoniobacterales bacterium]
MIETVIVFICAATGVLTAARIKLGQGAVPRDFDLLLDKTIDDPPENKCRLQPGACHLLDLASSERFGRRIKGSKAIEVEDEPVVSNAGLCRIAVHIDRLGVKPKLLRDVVEVSSRAPAVREEALCRKGVRTVCRSPVCMLPALKHGFLVFWL